MRPDFEYNRNRALLVAVLLVSLALRVLIAVRGGQYYWPDESRFAVSREAAAKLIAGNVYESLITLFSSAEHLLFKVIGVVPAIIESRTGGNECIPAIFFGSFSVLAIYLLWRVVLDQGGSSREALLAALLLAACNSFFYYARHVFPYDLALCFFLGSALFGMRLRFLPSVMAGLLSGVGFLSYNGYWLFGGTILLLTVLPTKGRGGEWIPKAICELFGLLMPIAAVLLIGHVLNRDLLRSYIAFASGTTIVDVGAVVHTGPRYFWSAEGYIVIVWVLAVLTALVMLVADKLETRAKVWIIGAAFFAIALVLLSDVARKFAVCGRHLRPFEIFMSLIGGWFIAKISMVQRLIGRLAFGVLVVGSLIAAGFNMAGPIKQEFPPGFEARAEGIILKDLERGSPGLYEVLTDGYFEGARSRAIEKRPMKILLSRPHPLEFAPYTFEGYTNEEREGFRTRDISMRVVRMLPEAANGREQVSRAAGPWAPYTGALRIEIMFDPAHCDRPLPIVSSGVRGAGDEVFIEFTGRKILRIGFDHWDASAIHSKSIPFDVSRPHVLIISIGSLYPDEMHPLFKENPSWLAMRHLILVRFDGSTELFERADSFKAPAASITILHNLLGFSTAERDFSGRLLSASSVSPDEILSESR
jgi:hypothetical protein